MEYSNVELKNQIIRDKMLLGITWTIFAGYFAINLLGIYLSGPYAWDDGAITLAYARTLAENGFFALNSSSEIVEGTSSLLFTFLMALLHKLINFNFNQFILASQIVAFICVCAMLYLVYRTLRKNIPHPLYRMLIVGLLGILPMFTAEVLNGMEMSLFSFLIVAFVLAYQNQSRLIFALIPFLLLTRFESFFYLYVSFLLLFIFSKEERQKIIRLSIYLTLVLALLTALRWYYFGDILPNTIWAKTHPPYSSVSSWSEIAYKKSLGLAGFIKANFFLLLMSFGAFLLQAKTWRRMDLKAAIVISFAIFALVTGDNWGYPGRMFLACLPLLTLLIVEGYTEISIRLSIVRPLDEEIKAFWSGELLMVFIAVFTLIAVNIANFRQFEENFRTSVYGGYFQNRLPNLLIRLADRSSTIQAGIRSGRYGVTPTNYRLTGEAVNNIRILLDLPVIKFMAPDVGGLGLCCDRIRVIDSALLTNQYLARNGYSKFNYYLEKTVPDLIEIHEPWSEFSGIYKSAFFQKNYLPLIFENNLFWMKKLELNQLLTSSHIVKKTIAEATVLVRYAGQPLDTQFLVRERLPVIWDINIRPQGEANNPSVP